MNRHSLGFEIFANVISFILTVIAIALGVILIASVGSITYSIIRAIWFALT